MLDRRLTRGAAGMRTQSRGRAMLGWGAPSVAWRAARMSPYGLSRRLRVEACLADHSVSTSSADIRPAARCITSTDARLLLLRGTRCAANSDRFDAAPCCHIAWHGAHGPHSRAPHHRRQPEKPRVSRGFSGQMPSATRQGASVSCPGGGRSRARRAPRSPRSCC